MFERPIVNGQCKDSTSDDVRLMRYRSHVLHDKLKGFVQRYVAFVVAACLILFNKLVIQLAISYHPLALQQLISFVLFGQKAHGVLLIGLVTHIVCELLISFVSILCQQVTSYRMPLTGKLLIVCVHSFKKSLQLTTN
jgi:hypothetical protein